MILPDAQGGLCSRTESKPHMQLGKFFARAQEAEIASSYAHGVSTRGPCRRSVRVCRIYAPPLFPARRCVLDLDREDHAVRRERGAVKGTIFPPVNVSTILPFSIAKTCASPPAFPSSVLMTMRPGSLLLMAQSLILGRWS